jgi:hypothetical protein
MKKPPEKGVLLRVAWYWASIGQPIRDIEDFARLTGATTPQLRRLVRAHDLWDKLGIGTAAKHARQHGKVLERIHEYIERNPFIVLPWLIVSYNKNETKRYRRVTDQVSGYLNDNPPVALPWLVARLNAKEQSP